MSYSGYVIACLSGSHPVYVWQLELTVNRIGPGKGKRLFPHASHSPLFQKSRLAKQALVPLTVCKLITLPFFFLLGPVMSSGPNCNDSHVIKVGGLGQRARGERRRAPLGLIILSICQTVCPRPPLGFPVWLQSKTDGRSGRMDRQGRPSLCCELRLTRARLD